MIDSPPTRSTFLRWHRAFLFNQEPTPRLFSVDLITNQQRRILRQPILQQPLRVVPLLVHFNQLFVVLNEEDSRIHSGITSLKSFLHSHLPIGLLLLLFLWSKLHQFLTSVGNSNL